MSTNATANTTVATIPTGWTQIAWAYGNSSNTTTSNSSGVVGTIDTSNFKRNILSAWTSTNKGQIDDIVGVTKVTATAAGVTATLYNPQHWVQFALAGTQASGT